MKTFSKVSYPIFVTIWLALVAPALSAADAATTGDPTVPIDQIIEQFVAKETEFCEGSGELHLLPDRLRFSSTTRVVGCAAGTISRPT